MAEDEYEVWSAFDVSIRDWDEQPQDEWNESPVSAAPPEKVLRRSRHPNSKKLTRKRDARSRSSSTNKEGTRRRSPKRNPSKELERRVREKSSKRDRNDAKKLKPRRSLSNGASRTSRGRSPYVLSSSSINDDSETDMSDAMRENVLRRSRGRTSPRKQGSRPRSVSRTPSRHKRRTAINLSPTLACARASFRVQRRMSWRSSKEEGSSASSDSESSDSDTSEADARRKRILDVSRKGPVRALSIGRKPLDVVGSSSHESAEESDDLLLENSSQVAGSSLVSSNSFSDNRSHSSVSKVEERVTRRTSADLSQMQVPDYYGNRCSDSETSIAKNRGRRASPEHAMKRKDSMRNLSGAARDSDRTVDDILKTRRLRRASASHRRGSAGGNENVGRLPSASHRRGSAGGNDNRWSSTRSSTTTSTSERPGNPKSLMKGFLSSRFAS